MITRQVEVWGRRVTFDDAGGSAAPPLVCLHGGGFDHAGLTWRPTAEFLSGSRRVVVPDLPGYGGSAALSEPPDIRRLGAWTAAFLDAAEIARADIAGLSMGGGMAIWLAIYRPERVRRLIAVCPYGVMARAPFHPLVFVAVRAGVLSLAYRAASTSGALARFGLALNYHDAGRVTEATVSALREVARDQSARRSFDAFLAAELRATGLKTDLRPELHRIGAPTLLVAGRKDRLVPARALRHAVERIAACRLLTLRTGHWPMRERPDLFDPALARFLSDRDPCGPARQTMPRA